MKKTLYSLLLLPFIAYGVNTIANEGDTSQAAHRKTLEYQLIAAGGSQSTEGGQIYGSDTPNHNEKVKKSLSPSHGAAYDNLSDQSKEKINKAYDNAKPGTEVDAAHMETRKQMNLEGKQHTNDGTSGYKFDADKETTPFQNSMKKHEARQQKKSDSSVDSKW